MPGSVGLLNLVESPVKSNHGKWTFIFLLFITIVGAWRYNLRSHPTFSSKDSLRPHFLLLGQQKAGTSSLWQYLMENPRIDSYYKKEPNFFGYPSLRRPGVYCGKSMRDYLNLFSRTYKEEYNIEKAENCLVGDFSSQLLTCTCCPALFSKILPNVRLILIIREPIERAASRFQEQITMNKTGAAWKQTFLQAGSVGNAANREIDVMNSCLDEIPNFDFKNSRHIAVTAVQSYLEAECLQLGQLVGYSSYAPFIENWLTYYPSEQLLVLYNEELMEKPLETLRLIEKHLNLKPYDYPPELLGTLYNSHSGGYGWDKTFTSDERLEEAQQNQVELGDLSKMKEFLRIYNERLNKLIDRGLIRKNSVAVKYQ